MKENGLKQPTHARVVPKILQRSVTKMKFLNVLVLVVLSPTFLVGLSFSADKDLAKVAKPTSAATLHIWPDAHPTNLEKTHRHHGSPSPRLAEQEQGFKSLVAQPGTGKLLPLVCDLFHHLFGVVRSGGNLLSPDGLCM